MSIDKPLMVPINKIIQQTPRVKSFEFDYPLIGKPGQFIMVWVPGYDEKPFGMINRNSESVEIAVAVVESSTKAMHAMKEGDLLGLRGPYGSHFSLPEKGKKAALIAGGYGMVPLSYLAQELVKLEVETHLYLGARNKDELLYSEWMQNLGVRLHFATDDGSAGYHGYVPDLFAAEAADQHFDKAYVVGPEIVEWKTANFCWEKNIPFEASLERYIKCAIGICGQCCVDPTGWRMCVEGPVLSGEDLKKVTEFGRYHRSASGKVEKFPWIKD